MIRIARSVPRGILDCGSCGRGARLEVWEWGLILRPLSQQTERHQTYCLSTHPVFSGSVLWDHRKCWHRPGCRWPPGRKPRILRRTTLLGSEAWSCQRADRLKASVMRGSTYVKSVTHLTIQCSPWIFFPHSEGSLSQSRSLPSLPIRWIAVRFGSEERSFG